MSRQNIPPVKIAVLIDGGFFVKRFNALYNKDRKMSGADVANYLYTMAHQHVGTCNTLYRIFYYDCHPLSKKVHNPITNKLIDFSKTPEYKFREELISELKKKRKVAIRIGDLKDNNNWHIYPKKVKELLHGDITVADLEETDVYLEIRQKGIDMKIGVDIASLALKRFVDTIVLFSGDCDFVPAAKLARREGVDFILDPMDANVEPQLLEHIDGMKSVKPSIRKSKIKNSLPLASKEMR
jgi:uncharacterized LabA/DUF88 family protein